MIYQCISIQQPWTNQIALGRKTIETRTWSVNYRGELLLASSGSPRIAPYGFAVAIGELVDCRPMTCGDESAAGCYWYGGAVAWVLANVSPIVPFRVTGRLGLYQIKRAEPVRRISVEEYAEYLKLENSRIGIREGV